MLQKSAPTHFVALTLDADSCSYAFPRHDELRDTSWRALDRRPLTLMPRAVMQHSNLLDASLLRRGDVLTICLLNPLTRR
jgi:hypothetical protein